MASPILIHGGPNTPPFYAVNRLVALEAGERREIAIPRLTPDDLDAVQIQAIPRSPAGVKHGYRIDSIETSEDDIYSTVTETANDAGGEVALLASVY